jgi:ribosomal protein S12 methylthiotransferase
VKFKIISLGCPKNLVESEYIVRNLENAGHVLAEEADTVIINTCAFIEDSTKESIETILEEAQRKRVVVTGCLLERYGQKLPELMPEVDLFVGRNYYTEITNLIDKKGLFLREGSFAETFPRRILTGKPSAYLKIQEGCDNRCSYCTVPDIRGGLKSRRPDDVVMELEWLLDNGFTEINIIGQDITSYGKHENTDLLGLLRRILMVRGDYYLRLLYMHPRGVTDELIGFINSDERIIKYMDIPVQHSENKILSLMGRGYTKGYLENLLGDIRERIPDAALRTTAIVGFPGETDDDFECLYEFIKKWEFDMLGAFMYSKEEGTGAYKMKGHVKKGVKRLRYNRIMEVQKEISKKRLAMLQGKTTKVIVEGKEEGHMVGRLLTQAPDIDGIAFIKGKCVAGEICEGKIVKTLDYDVIVEV